MVINYGTLLDVTELTCTASNDYDTSSREAALSSSPPHLDVSLSLRHNALGYTPQDASRNTSLSLVDGLGHVSGHASQSLDRTSSTAVRDTDVQFLNDSLAVAGRSVMSCTRKRQPRTHHVSVTIPTDTGQHDVTTLQAGTRSTAVIIPADIRQRDMTVSRAGTKSTADTRHDVTTSQAGTMSTAVTVPTDTIQLNMTNSQAGTKSTAVTVPADIRRDNITTSQAGTKSVADTRHNVTTLQGGTKSTAVTFQYVEPSLHCVIGSNNDTTSTVVTNRQNSNNVLPSADSGNNILRLC